MAIAKGLRARKPYFLKVAVSDVVHIAKKVAELGAAVFNAGGVPKAGRDGDIVKAFALLLGADLQIGSAHNMQKNTAVQCIKAGQLFKPQHGGMLFCGDDPKHILL